MTLTINQQAPDISLQNQEDKTINLSDYKGKWVLVYFYPKDDTPGCTIEACLLSSNLPDFSSLNAVVLGVSIDNVKSHKKFHDKYKLSFDLLADTEKKVVESYGVWAEKKFIGRSYMGINRSSFLINPEGKIVKIYENVKPPIHAKEVVNDLKQYNQSS